MVSRLIRAKGGKQPSDGNGLREGKPDGNFSPPFLLTILILLVLVPGLSSVCQEYRRDVGRCQVYVELFKASPGRYCADQMCKKSGQGLRSFCTNSGSLYDQGRLC